MGVWIVLGIWLFLWIASSAIISKNNKKAARRFGEPGDDDGYYSEPEDVREERRPFSYDDQYRDYSEEAGYERYTPAVSGVPDSGAPAVAVTAAAANSIKMPPPLPTMGRDMGSVPADKLIAVERAGPSVEYMFKDGFELDKAIAYSEIMNPKYKEY